MSASRPNGNEFRKPVVIDTDPGLDDALALVLALRSTALDVRAITVVAGNVPLAACTANALRILEAVGPPTLPDVFEGHARPLSRKVARAGHVHGDDGLGGITAKYPVRHLATRDRHATRVMVDLARQHGKDLTIIALGPLTNVAKAIERDPEAMSGIGQLVVMGGTDDGKGNATPRAEFNFFSDAVAAKAVVRAGLPTTLVGLNVTRETLLCEELFRQRLAAAQPERLRAFLADVSRPYFEFGRKESGRHACVMHDPLAVGVAIDPTLVSTEPLPCDVVDTPGLMRGMMLVDRDGTSAETVPANVATAVNADQFIELFLGVVCAG